MRIPRFLIAAIVAVSACAPDTLPEVSRPVRDSLRPFAIAPRQPCDPAVISAVENGRTDEVRRLTTSGIPANCGALETPTPLSTAIHRDSPDMVRALLEGGADPNARWWQWGDRLPLQDALEARLFGFTSRHQVEVVRLLLEHGADPNARWCPFESRHHPGAASNYPLGCVPEEGTTPLAVAVWNGSAEVVAMLLNAGADAESADWLDMTPIDYLHDSSVASVLLPRVFPDEATRGTLALRAMEGSKGGWISPANQTPLGRALSGWGGVRSPDPPPPPPCPPGKVRGCTPPAELHRLVNTQIARNIDRISVILSLGADPNERFSSYGVDWPPVALASGGGLKALLDHGADGDARWCVPVSHWSYNAKPLSPMPGCTLERGMTRLMTAAANGNVEDVTMLLQHGADATLKDWTGQSATDYARAAGHSTVVALLQAARTQAPNRN